MNPPAGVVPIAHSVLVAIAMVLAEHGGISPVQLNLFFAAASGHLMLALLFRIGVRGLHAVVLAVALMGGAVFVQLDDPKLQLAPYLAIAVINSFVALVFARGLLPGREPIILQVIRLAETGPQVTCAFRRFIYGQCWVWMGFGLGTALCSLCAMICPGIRAAADAVIIAIMVSQVAWFVGSHRYANFRYGRPETWLGTARAVSRRSLWASLEI